MKLTPLKFKELIYCDYCKETTAHDCISDEDSKLTATCTECKSKVKEL